MAYSFSRTGAYKWTTLHMPIGYTLPPLLIYTARWTLFKYESSLFLRLQDVPPVRTANMRSPKFTVVVQPRATIKYTVAPYCVMQLVLDFSYLGTEILSTLLFWLISRGSGPWIGILQYVIYNTENRKTAIIITNIFIWVKDHTDIWKDILQTKLVNSILTMMWKFVELSKCQSNIK